MIHRAWLIFKNNLVHLLRGGEDRIAIEEHGKALSSREANRRQRAIERAERKGAERRRAALGDPSGGPSKDGRGR
jgi:hypothetical protein